MSVNQKVNIGVGTRVVYNDTDDNTSKIKAQRTVSAGKNHEWLNGSGADQANKHVYLTGTIAGAGNVVINLNAVSDALGTVNFASIKSITLVNLTDDSNARLVMGANAGTPFVGPFGAGTHTLECAKQGQIHLDNPDGTPAWSTSGANNLKLANPGTATVGYELLIVGLS